jgi:hypothetical protein
MWKLTLGYSRGKTTHKNEKDDGGITKVPGSTRGCQEGCQEGQQGHQ